MKSISTFTLLIAFTYLGAFDAFGQSPAITYRDVSSTHLPTGTLGGNSMDARPADLDNDGDLDIVVACEFCRNRILMNDGSGVFTDETNARLPNVIHDSEDIGIADFDLDGDVDIIFVSEDDQTNELYYNDGTGVFTDETARLQVSGTSNAVLVLDVDEDEDPDILIGNAGFNVILLNDGAGNFVNDSTQRFENANRTTQDIEAGDVFDPHYMAWVERALSSLTEEHGP